MPTYCVTLKTDSAVAETKVEADNIDAAFKKALKLDPDRLRFEPFTQASPVQEIFITDSIGDEWEWRSEDLLVRLAAEELLIAAKNVITALAVELLVMEDGAIVRSTLRHLKQAVDAAEGRRS